jgi:hypothetical protein
MRTRRTLAATTLLLSNLSITACRDRSTRASQGDTGVAAPATVRDMSATPAVPDSTANAATTTGASTAASQPPVAGGTTSAGAKKGKPTAKHR